MVLLERKNNNVKLSLLNTPLKVGLVATTILLTLTIGRWWFGDHDISRFIVCGDQFTDTSQLPTPLKILSNSSGYDGQFFARLAFSPLDQRKSAYGITLDSPPYRQQRIIYPILAWIMAAGRAELVPWTLVLVNFLALVGIAIIAATMAHRFHLYPGYGLLVMLSSGFLLSFGRNLAEPLAGFFVLLALYFLLEKRLVGCAIFASFGVLTRESAIITFGAVGLLTMWNSFREEKRPHDYSFLWLLLPLAFYIGWQTYLTKIWGHPPATTGPSLNPWPLYDFFAQLCQHPYQVKPLACLVLLLYLGWYLWLALEVLTSFRTQINKFVSKDKNYLRTLRLAWVFWALFTAFLPICMWEDDWGFTRILAEWSMLGWLCLFAAGKKPSKKLLLFTLLLATGSVLRLWLRP